MIDRVGPTYWADIATHHFATTTGIYPHTYSSPFAFAVEICTLACLRLSLSGFPNTTCSGCAPPWATAAFLFSSASFFALCANVKLFHHVLRLALVIASAAGSGVVFGAEAVVVMGSGGEAGEGLSVPAGPLTAWAA